MTQINAYLTFGGNCREAMEFYRDALGGELTIQTIGESPVCDQLPPQARDHVMHASLVRQNIVLLASDMSEGPLVQGNTITLCLNCSSEAEVQQFFQRLSEGGHVSHPLKVEFWGATFGTLTDRFGQHWMLHYHEGMGKN